MTAPPAFRVLIATASAPCGAFRIRVDAETHRIVVQRDGDDGTPLWSSAPGQSFLAAAVGRARFGFRRGSFRIRDRTLLRVRATGIDAFTATADSVLVSGPTSLPGLRFQLRFTVADAATDELRLVAEMAGHRAERINRLRLVWESWPDERFLGFGAQYDGVDMKGRNLPIWSQEQGVGRGLQPLSRMLDLVSPGSAGAWHTTYTAVPFCLTTRARGFAFEGYEYCRFDLRDPNLVRFTAFTPRLAARLYAGTTPAAVLHTHTRFSGRMPPLPDWVQRGAIVRVHGGSAAVRDRVARLRVAGVPLAAVWIEDWCGKRKTLFGTRLWWNWCVDRSRYPDWSELIAELRAVGVRVVTYFNPYLVDTRSNSDHARHLYAEAQARALLVRRRDGRPYEVGQGGFRAALVDLANPEARAWLKAVMREQIELGVSGWMNDFSEALPPDCVLHGGEEPTAYHNRYVEEWARVAREAVRESGREGDVVFFSRAGALRSPGIATLFWLGDQTVSWDGFDGIRTVVPALLSSGLSGFSLNHADIGGYLSASIPGAPLHRSAELHQRWAELAAFTPVFRTHDTNEPERNHLCDSSPETLAHFASMARLYVALGPYRRGLEHEAAATGMPLVRHLVLHYPDDPAVRGLEQQFLLGPDLLVAPVLDPGAGTVRVYVPAGDWVQPWTGVVHAGPGWIEAEAPIGRPAAFARAGSAVLDALRAWTPEGADDHAAPRA